MKNKTLHHVLKISLFMLLSLVWASSVSAKATDSFKAYYKIRYGSLSLGEITFKLRPAKQPGCYIYSGKGKPNFIVSALIGNLAEESHFCINDDDVLVTQSFSHEEKGKDKHTYTVEIDWDKQQAHYKNKQGKKRTLDVDEPVTDPLSIQVAARHWLNSVVRSVNLPDKTFAVVSKDKIKHYTLSVEEGGRIKVPAGLYNTLLVERVDDKDKHLKFWLAKYADWLPVKVEHQQGSRVITMEMTKISQ